MRLGTRQSSLCRYRTGTSRYHREFIERWSSVTASTSVAIGSPKRARRSGQLHDDVAGHPLPGEVAAQRERERKKHEQPTRHGAAHGLGWGLAVGAVSAILPGIGLLGGLAGGGGAGAAIGAVTGHMKGGMDDERPEASRRRAGKRGQAGLIVVYATNMADQIAANIKAVNKHESKQIDANADELARQLHAAEAGR